MAIAILLHPKRSLYDLPGPRYKNSALRIAEKKGVAVFGLMPAKKSLASEPILLRIVLITKISRENAFNKQI